MTTSTRARYTIEFKLEAVRDGQRRTEPGGSVEDARGVRRGKTVRQAIQAEVRGEYGWPRIWKELLARGIRVGKDRVQKLMQRHAIASAGRQCRTRCGSATDYGMRSSMSRKGNCWDNAPTERLWGSLKVGRLYGRQFGGLKTMSSTIVRGGCLCGAVRYEIDGPILAPEHCHCGMCRKAHGAAFSTNAVVEATRLRVLAGADLLTAYESSPNRQRCFCSRCGSQLFIRRRNHPDIAVVTLGTLDGDPAARPIRHVFTASKAAWHDFDDALPRFQVYPGFEPTDEPE